MAWAGLPRIGGGDVDARTAVGAHERFLGESPSVHARSARRARPHVHLLRDRLLDDKLIRRPIHETLHVAAIARPREALLRLEPRPPRATRELVELEAPVGLRHRRQRPEVPFHAPSIEAVQGHDGARGDTAKDAEPEEFRDPEANERKYHQGEYEDETAHRKIDERVHPEEVVLRRAHVRARRTPPI